jgi:hypothetical protein
MHKGKARHEDVWGSGCIDPRFLDFVTSWRWVVSVTPLPLYPGRKSPWYPLDKRLGGLQSRSGRRGEEKILDPTGTRTPDPSIAQPVASRYTYCAIPTSRNAYLVRNIWRVSFFSINCVITIKCVSCQRDVTQKHQSFLTWIILKFETN